MSVISKKQWLKLREEFLTKQQQQINSLKAELTQLDEQLKQKIDEKYKTKNTNIKTDDITKGCIIKLSLKSIDDKDYDVFKLSRQQFKDKKISEEFSTHIAYVDIQKHSNRIYIRCKSKESALIIFNSNSFLNEFQKSILDGVEEIEYFEKIYSNRNKKLEKKDKKVFEY